MNYFNNLLCDLKMTKTAIFERNICKNSHYLCISSIYFLYYLSDILKTQFKFQFNDLIRQEDKSLAVEKNDINIGNYTLILMSG